MSPLALYVAMLLGPGTDRLSVPPPAQQQHGLLLAYEFMHFVPSASAAIDVRALSVGYQTFVGDRWGFAGHIAATVPLTIRQGSFTDLHPDRARGFDALAGFALNPGFRGDRIRPYFGAGAHVNGVWIRPSMGPPLTSFVGGFGAVARFSIQLSHRFALGVYANASLDFIDFVHGGDLAVGVVTNVGLTLGWASPSAKPEHGRGPV